MELHSHGFHLFAKLAHFLMPGLRLLELIDPPLIPVELPHRAVLETFPVIVWLTG